MTSMKTRRFGLAIESVVLCLVASQPALATDPTPNWCEGVRIAAFPGGYGPGSGDRYSEAVYNGYRQAALDLGPTVTFYFSHWSPDEMIRDFKRAIDEKVDGVALHRLWLQCSRRLVDPRSLCARHDRDLYGCRAAG